MARIHTPPKKVYYTISEVSSICSIKSHVLRYWESEFPPLKPKKNRGGRRAYTEADIWVIREIKRLLYEERFTIDGAKKRISSSGGKKIDHFQVSIPFDEQRAKKVLNVVKKEMEEVLKILET